MPFEKKDSSGIFGEDCERPACDTIKQAMPGSMEALQELSAKQKAKKKVECPPRSAELGRSSWKLLHTMVRAEKPNEARQLQVGVCLCAHVHPSLCVGCMVSRYTLAGAKVEHERFLQNFI